MDQQEYELDALSEEDFLALVTGKKREAPVRDVFSGNQDVLSFNIPEEFEIEDVITQQTVDVLAKFGPTELLRLRFNKQPVGTLYSQQTATLLAIRYEPSLRGMTLKTLVTAANRLCSAFRPDSEDGSVQSMRNGSHRRSEEDENTLVPRDPMPNVGWVSVSQSSTFMARMFCASVKPSSQHTLSEEDNAVTQVSSLVVANAPGIVPKIPELLTLGRSLLAKSASGSFAWAWDIIAQTVVRKGADVTGLDLLYWAYRSASTNWKPLTKAGPKVFAKTFNSIKSLKVPRDKIKGLLDHSVWWAGSPVPPNQIIGSFIELCLKKVSLHGHFASDLVTWITNRDVYCTTTRLPDPNAKVTLHPTDPKDVLLNTSGLFWSPSKEVLSKVTGHAIAIPISTPLAAATLAQQWMGLEFNYDLAVTYGSNPVLWVMKSAEGVSKQEAGPIAHRLAASALWVFIYNMNSHLQGLSDVWAYLFRSKKYILLKTNVLSKYKYCPVQEGANPIISRLAWDDLEYKPSDNEDVEACFVTPQPKFKVPPSKRPPPPPDDTSFDESTEEYVEEDDMDHEFVV